MVTIVALKFAMSSHFPLPKTFALFVPTLSNGGCPVLLLIEKMNQINTKNYWKEKKEIVREVALGDKHHLRKSSDRKAQIRKVFVPLTGLICAFLSEDFLRWCLSPSATSHTISFFYFQ